MAARVALDGSLYGPATDGHGRPAVSVTALDDSVIRRIASWGGDAVATSLYLDVDGSRHPRWSDVERRVDHLFRSARSQARAAFPGQEGDVEADLAETRAWLDHGVDRSAVRGVALFACAAKGLFEPVPLAVPVRDQVVVGSEADVAQLCSVVATSWSAVAVAVDKQRWRVVRLERGGEVLELDVLDDTAPRSVDVDRELAGFERHEAELAREHLRRVARVVTDELTRRPAHYLVLFGTEDSVKHLEALLPRQVAASIAGRVPLPASPGLSELAGAARIAVEHARDERRAAVLATLRERAATTGTSVVTGLDATLGAVTSARVATLVVERTFESPGVHCDACRLLAARANGPCPRCGGPLHGVENVVDSAVVDAFLHRAALEVVADGSLENLGRIAAIVHPWGGTENGGATRA